MTVQTLDLEKFRSQLQQRLANASSESELLLGHSKPWQRELLWRAALPLRVDEETINRVLLDELEGDDPGKMGGWLKEHPAFEIDATATPTLGARSSVRQDTVIEPLKSPTGDREAQRVRAHAAQLARHFGSRGSLWELDALSVLVLSDPLDAAQRATRWILQALRKADFTRAFRVLRTLEDRAPEIAALAEANHSSAPMYRELEKRVAELRRRYDSARAFAGDFERTTHVLERKAMQAQWRWLVRPPRTASRLASAKARSSREQWLLNVEARGGAGKSMFLRWLSARKCATHGIPYARLDFDFVDPRLTNGASWYLVAQMARMLDPQLPGRPLRSLVGRVDDVAPFGEFSLGHSEANRMLGKLRSEVSSELGASVLEDFAAALNQSSASTIVLVLDTLEVALLHPEADVLGLLRELKRLHDRCPKVRLILSGRFDLRTRLPQFVEEFDARTREFEIEPLSPDESVAYLTQRRGMRDGPVVRAIVKRCGGLPFALSLFADEWQTNPKLTAKEVRETPGPELHYLVERVLKRVPDVIAWLVRYGVVPRRLTRAFVADVIVPELEELRRGKRYDNPLRDSREVRKYFDKARLELGKQELSADLLWNDLEQHASGFSFITRDPNVPNCLVLHPDVVRPMQRELRKHRVFRRLHRRAMELALSRTQTLDATSQDDWATDMDDALYHALRTSEAKARGVWHTARERANCEAAFSATALIATRLLDDSVDVPVELRVDAARQRTEALIAMGLRHQSDASEWERARVSHQQWRRVLRQARARTDASFHVAKVRIASRTGLAQGSGLRTLERLIRQTRRPEDRLELHAALVEGFSHRPAAMRHISASRALIAGGRHEWSPTAVQRFNHMACGEMIRQGDNASALQLAQEVAAGSRYLALSEKVAALATLIHLLTNCGLVSRLKGVLARAAQLDGFIVAEGRIRDGAAFDARVWLRAEAVRAHAFGGPSPPPALPINDDEDPTSRSTQTIVDAMILASRLDSAKALSLLQEARGLGGSPRAEVAARVLTIAATHYALVIGDLRQARELMSEAKSLTLAQGSVEWWIVNYLMASLNPSAAKSSFTRLVAENRKRPTAWGTLLVGLMELSDSRKSRKPSRTLADAIRRIRPVAAARRHVAESLPALGGPIVPSGSAGEIAGVLRVNLRYARQQHRGSAIGPAIEHWMVCRLAGISDQSAPSEWQGSTCLDLARWMCATNGKEPPTVVDDALLTSPGDSDLARGIAHFAYASALQAIKPAKAREHVRQAHDILAGSSVPANLWLARTDLLSCRLGAPSHRTRESTLLFVEELCERLDARSELEQARALRKSNVEDDRADIIGIRMADPRVIHGGRSRILKAIRVDGTRSTSYRMPDRVTKELASGFATAVLDIGRHILPHVEGPPGSTARLVFVSREPVYAALPLELALAIKESARRERGKQSPVAPGWRSVDEPRNSANERWALRVFDSINEGAADTSDIAEQTKRFQASRQLEETGQLDAATLRGMVRAIRNERPPAAALVLTSRDSIWQRGHRLLEGIYRSRSTDLTLLAGGTRATLEALASGSHDVIHIVAPLVESSSFGGLAFDLSPGSGEMSKSASREYLSISELVSAIKRPRSLLRPVVVVQNSLMDLPPYETTRQFALRNIVAMELFRSGGPVATVAVSASPERGEDSMIISALAEVLLAGDPLSTFLERLDSPKAAKRRRPRDATFMAQELQLYATSVFANNPDHIVL